MESAERLSLGVDKSLDCRRFAAVRENRKRNEIGWQSEMLYQYALEHAAYVGCWSQVTLLEKIGPGQPRPVGDDAPAVDRAASQ